MGATQSVRRPAERNLSAFNGIRTRRWRGVAASNNLTYLMNLFRNDAFIYANSQIFSERLGGIGYFGGEGEYIDVLQGRHQWETNFVPDLADFELKAMPTRGAGGTSIRFILGDGSIGCHCSEIPAGTYKKGHRHMNGVVIHAVTGKGYSLLWYEGEEGLPPRRLASRRDLFAAGPDVPSAFQHLARAVAISCRADGQRALSNDPGETGHLGAGRRFWPPCVGRWHADRIR